MPDAKVLVIEDEPDLADALGVVLKRAGYESIRAAQGKEGLRLVHDHRPDIVILDVGLPDIDGWEVLERIRDFTDTPVVMLTARGLEQDKVRGLDSGADDYVTKPFSNVELVSRINALLRRSGGGAEVESSFRAGNVAIRFDARLVTVDGDEVRLTPLEFRLLAALARHRGQVLSVEQLLDLAWNDPFGIAPERVKFTVARLRKKLAERDAAPIETVRGFGYRFAG